MLWLKNYFRFDQRNAVLKKEIIGGLSTFLAMCYIVAVNPSMVSAADGAQGLTGGLFLATAIASFLATMFMGLWARVPVALAPGMGINAFFTFTVAGVGGSGIGFESALSVTILSGILYFIIVMTPARQIISKQIPHNYKIAIGAGIGLFIAYLGLQNSGVITSTAPLVSKIGDFTNPLVLTAMCLIFLGLILHFAKVPGALIITMLIGGLVVVILATTGVINQGVENYGLLAAYGDFGSFTTVVKSGWLGFANVEMWTSPLTYIAIFTFLYADFFDTTGTLIAINRIVDFDKADPTWMAKANQVDAIATVFGAGIGSTTVTSFAESTVGVSVGAKTGLASVVTALCFAVVIAAWPIMQIFMPVAYEGVSYQPVTSPILVVVGVLMISQLKFFKWAIVADIPTLFMTILFMMLTNSIASGLSFGMITFALINLSLGIVQKIKKQPTRIIDDDLLPLSDDLDYDGVKTVECDYLKRLNPTTIVITVIAILSIVLEAVIPLL